MEVVEPLRHQCPTGIGDTSPFRGGLLVWLGSICLPLADDYASSERGGGLPTLAEWRWWRGSARRTLSVMGKNLACPALRSGAFGISSADTSAIRTPSDCRPNILLYPHKSRFIYLFPHKKIPRACRGIVYVLCYQKPSIFAKSAEIVSSSAFAASLLSPIVV